MESLRSARAASQSSALLLLDLSTAFDTVNHQIFLSALKDLTFCPLLVQVLLSERSFRVSWRGEVSKLHNLSTGVPQVSGLGPLLLTIYTTSLDTIMPSHGFSYHCYADDTQVFLSFPPDTTQSQLGSWHVFMIFRHGWKNVTSNFSSLRLSYLNPSQNLYATTDQSNSTPPNSCPQNLPETWVSWSMAN